MPGMDMDTSDGSTTQRVNVNLIAQRLEKVAQKLRATTNQIRQVADTLFGTEEVGRGEAVDEKPSTLLNLTEILEDVSGCLQQQINRF